MADDRQLRQALIYARHRWPVFPVAVGEKTPVTPHGFLDATTDESRIQEWWRRNPSWNIGLATGHPGPDVVDVDRHSTDRNGFAAWNAARREGLVQRPLAIIATPSGGIHAYFCGSDQRSAATSAHVDFRGQGGYVVAPHSTVGGKPYVVVHRDPQSTARVDFGAVRQLVEPQREHTPWSPPPRMRAGGQQNLDHLVQHMAELDDGRKRYLFWAANRILDHGQPERLADLAAAARAAGSEPRQIDRTIESARQQQRQDPYASARTRESVCVRVPRDGRRPALEPGADRERAAQAIHSSAKPAERHPELGNRGPTLEKDPNEPEHQTAAEEPQPVSETRYELAAEPLSEFEDGPQQEAGQ